MVTVIVWAPAKMNSTVTNSIEAVCLFSTACQDKVSAVLTRAMSTAVYGWVRCVTDEPTASSPDPNGYDLWTNLDVQVFDTTKQRKVRRNVFFGIGKEWKEERNAITTRPQTVICIPLSSSPLDQNEFNSFRFLSAFSTNSPGQVHVFPLSEPHTTNQPPTHPFFPLPLSFTSDSSCAYLRNLKLSTELILVLGSSLLASFS